MRSFFGTDGIRGRVGKGGLLTPEFAKRIGYAAAKHLCPEGRAFLLGFDTRESSPALANAVFQGLRLCGSYVYVVSVIPTPAVSFLCKRLDTFGVMITASHNPFDHNGIKLFAPSGEKLSDEAEEAIEREFLALPDSIDVIPPSESSISLVNAEEAYISSLKERLALSGISELDIFSPSPRLRARRLRIAVDGANGAASKIAQKLFSELCCSIGAEVFFLGVSPNGKNINLSCGSTDTRALSDAVVKNRCDIGIALDGDGDRCIFTDEAGRVLDGDAALSVFAARMKERGLLKNDTVVGTLMSNGGLEEFLLHRGIRLIRAQVGDRYVSDAMLSSGAVLGGEGSGHVIFGSVERSGDGLLTALMLLTVLCDAPDSRPLSAILGDYAPRALVTVNLEVSENFKRYFSSLSPADVLQKDEIADTLVRPSGTESLIRITVQKKSRAEAESCAHLVADRIRAMQKERQNE